jgi:hypothetical protein
MFKAGLDAAQRGMERFAEVGPIFIVVDPCKWIGETRIQT